jgi:formylglycine-generating enzyme required for sulfatase activity
MPSRPSIPADMTRQILIESGHRCAVCGAHCPLERAHIIPWHKSKEHKAEDLICLCASCHERADLEEWGENTLREYKRTPWVLRQYQGPQFPLESPSIQKRSSSDPPREPEPRLVSGLMSQLKQPDPIKLHSFEFSVLTLSSEGVTLDQHPEQGEFFIEHLGSGIRLEMIKVQGGTFSMGSAEGELRRKTTEGPQHPVHVPTFYMSKYEVTLAQWSKVRKMVAVDKDMRPPYFYQFSNLFPDGAGPAGIFILLFDLFRWLLNCTRRRKLPMQAMSWYEAAEFCNRLSIKTGRRYRLPTEAEWEYACRAHTTTPFSSGETITSEYVNYDGRYPYGLAPRGRYRKRATPVGKMRISNALGLFDMHGNLWEWCLDRWHQDYEGAPNTAIEWKSDGDESLRVQRGGSFRTYASRCRSAARRSSDPNPPTHELDPTVGFRVVVSATDEIYL